MADIKLFSLSGGVCGLPFTSVTFEKRITNGYRATSNIKDGSGGNQPTSRYCNKGISRVRENAVYRRTKTTKWYTVRLFLYHSTTTADIWYR
ncbi:MAG: hypothetical protein LBD23_07540, partial [Oscillospiraceae bacterium]|nr:hypothetical protein [Oscillospiraceae bacterium]